MNAQYYVVRTLCATEQGVDEVARQVNVAIEDLSHGAVLVSTYSEAVAKRTYVHGVFRLNR